MTSAIPIAKALRRKLQLALSQFLLILFVVGDHGDDDEGSDGAVGEVEAGSNGAETATSPRLSIMAIAWDSNGPQEYVNNDMSICQQS